MTQVLSTCMTRTPCVLMTMPIRSSHLISHANHTDTQDHSAVTVMRAQNCCLTTTTCTQVPCDNNGHRTHDDYLGPEPCATTMTMMTTWAHSLLRHNRGQVPQSPHTVMTWPPNLCPTTMWARAPAQQQCRHSALARQGRGPESPHDWQRGHSHSPRNHHMGPDTLRSDEGAATQPLC